MIVESGAAQHGTGKRFGGSSGEKVPGLGADDVMTVGRDFDELLIGVGEMEEDGLGGAAISTGTDAGEDFADGEVAVGGARFERADGGLHGLLAGEDAAFLVKAVGEPVAECSGGDGPTVIASSAVGNDGPGVSEGGAEGGGEFECVVEDLFGAGFGHIGAFWLEDRGWGS